MSAATRYWSESKRAWIVLEDMHDNHLLAAHAKFARGDYRVPDDPDNLTGVMREPHPGERQWLARTFDAEMKRRGIGPYAPMEGVS